MKLPLANDNVRGDVCGTLEVAQKATVGNGSMRVLHVDDDESMLEISKQILLDMGSFEIDFAHSVNEAFKKLAVGNYDVVVSDYEMPQKNGLEFLKELREQNNEIPFILFTGKGREEVAIKALNLGADAYVNKQGNPETVYGELSHALIKATERRTAEKLLTESESKYRILVQNSLVGIAIVEGSPPKIVFANSSMGRIFQLSPEAIVALSPEEIISRVHPDDRDQFLNSFERLVEGKETKSTYEYRGIREDCSIVWFEVCPTLIDYGGKQAVQAVFLDVTERKKAEESVKKSEARYRELVDALPAPIFEVDERGKVIFANSEAFKMSGYFMEDLEKGLCVFNLVPKREWEAAKKRDSQSPTGVGSKESEYTFTRKDGAKFPVIVNYIPIVREDGSTIIRGVFIDITGRKKTEEALRQERDKLESLTANIGAGLVIISKDYKILWMNNYLKRLTRASEGSPCYSSFNTCASICPDCGPEKIFEGASIDRREYCNQTEFRRGHPVWTELIATPIKDKDGIVVAALELTVNITEKKEAEKKQRESSDRIEMMNEKLRVVGSLTRHDVSNKLSAVNAYSYLLKKKYKDQPDVVEGLKKIEQAVAESAEIFEFAKMYEQLGLEKLTFVDVGEAVDGAVALFSDFKLKFDNDCHGISVLADSFLRQMFYNLVDNTLKHGKKASAAKVYCEQEASGGLRLIYEDNGVGISAENKKKLFSEGFSTGGSTGFGLFFIKKMVDVYGWTITEEGEPDEGAKFNVTIPRRTKDNAENFQLLKLKRRNKQATGNRP
jgi:PAS domain S-box-containing protein